jgi:hypothetical protein
MTEEALSPLPPSSIIQRTSRPVHCDLEGLVVLMDVESGEYFELNHSGTRLWEALETPATVESVVERMMTRYDVDRVTCETEVRAWVDAMRRLGFVAAQDAPAGEERTA